MNPSEYLNATFGLTGKVAVVIGGTGELCGAMAEGLAGAGAEVVIVGRNVDKAQARLDRIAAAGGKAWFHAAEATNKAELDGLRDAVLKRSGRIDILVNGAGINSATPFFDITEEEFDRILRVNVKGVFLGCQVFGKYLVDRGQCVERQDAQRGRAVDEHVVELVAAAGQLVAQDHLPPHHAHQFHLGGGQVDVRADDPEVLAGDAPDLLQLGVGGQHVVNAPLVAGRLQAQVQGCVGLRVQINQAHALAGGR